MGNIEFEKWRKMAGVGIVCFSYKKLDGTLRKAIGTRNITVANYFGFSEFEKGKGKRHNPNAYFDLERREWRSYSLMANSQLELIEGQEENEMLEKVGISWPG